MVATQAVLREWLLVGQTQRATHMIVVRDTYDCEDFPVYVVCGEDPNEVALQFHDQNQQKVLEVYALHLDLELQLNEHRAFHFDVI